ncbi:UDP-glucose-glycoprotein glucosyltransferase [Naegleria gruberi]|uniref:UDP-glucose-glycoprotein glucosyltransferase n=1 Tax=Naegleria gruberi TaxID=5762 RepID=D2VE03_NAEGR|nr:UDP-glucose-glycoprotein glucosyltransferase [Naegleria gruberi]EFC44990.1 UDP-glucose-glycoprotein glucosyltransferase [Naegleria gruberi]|eukprot:XP_002677734.1 UDP-glucose-glycoprotein glucosyltransferase [Naegleria gruberi strain NEG-M]
MEGNIIVDGSFVSFKFSEFVYRNLLFSEYFSDKLPDRKTSFLKSIPCEKVDQIKNDRNAILTLAQQSKATVAEVSLLDFALDTRHYSPRVKVQYTKNTNIVKSNLNTIVPKNVEDIEVLDHTFNINSETQINFIYSDITTQEGCKFVKENIDSIKPIVLRLVRLDSTGSIDKEEMIKEKYMEEASSDLLSIRGYGVELQIKNMEYKQTADDDVVSGNDTFYKGVNFNKLKKNYPHLSNDLDTLKLHIQQSDSKSEKLKVWEMKYFGVQAMKKISDQPSFDEKIKMLQDISQNFPSYMKELKNTAFENSFKDQIQSHLSRYDGEFKSRNPNNPQEVIRRNALFLNGLELDLTKLSVFSLFETMDKELKLVKSLSSDYHLSSNSVESVLFTPSTASKDLRFKFSSELEKQVIWFNNIESDSYNNFPRDLKSMLHPTMYGQMRFVRRNLFNVVFILDPASTQKQVAQLLYILGNIMNRGYPIRIGALFIPKVSSGFVDVDLTGSSSASPETVDELSLHAVSLLERMAKENRAVFPILREFMDRESFDSQFVDDLQKRFFGSVRLMSQQELISRYRSFTNMGFDVKSSPIVMVNGAVIQGEEQDSGDQLVMKGVREQYDAVKNLIENNVVVDNDKNLLEKIINHYGGFDKFNSEIFSKKQYGIVSLGDIDQINFVQHPESGGVVKKTHIVCVGDNQDASLLVKEAISFISKNQKTRIGFLNVADSSFSSLAKYHVLYKPNGSNQLSGKNFCSKHFNAKESGIISMNGRIIPLTNLFTSKDITILDAFEDVNSAIISTIESNSYSTVDPDIVTSDYLSDVLFGVSSVLKVFNQYKRQDLNHVQSSSVATLETESNPSAEIKLIAILNPLSKFAQKISPLIRFVKEKLGKSVNVVVHLNPDLETSNLPLQSYYTYVLSGSSVAEFNTRFSDVKGRIFTMWMDVPESWLVDSTYAKEDLDNLKLDECASQKCYARFQLEYFVASGTCIDDNGRPVRGLQLQLVHNYGVNATNVDDTTLVMANYGYFQLRASSPNIYSVNLPKGRHSDIYSVQSTKQVDFYSQSELQHSDGYGSADTKKFLISVHSFDAPFARVVVKRNSGMEKEDLLAPTPSSGGWSSWLSSNSNQEKKTIHIFSLASGLMYERLLKIMILSVRKHLKRSDVKVKFWFLKQFLSPSLKQFLPEYAKAYNFEYGLISYQWPHWLHKQQTKQRLIWAYKVLFLDVLFPLQEVNKIIFVDADQVCRTDMSELFFDLDMQGKALAYTPFCESRKEMDGYRFWKTGYWANHLGGRPYHISALYVVDIDMFRRNYHGDQFRMVYDNLARDPNSLSNLDQDLPNYAQHNVPIRSLPQEWLWCESWCSDESKAKAKTIDLCNNPQTKEHKLASAKRIIPEWTDYDNEIKDFQKKLVVGK